MQKPGETGAGGGTSRVERCPHLGLEGDPSTFCLEPSPGHRCYLWMERSRIDLAHQARFCLTDSHSICPWLSIGAMPTTRLESAVLQLRRTMRSVLGRFSRRALAIAVAFWSRLRSAVGRGMRFLGARAEEGLIGLGNFALRLSAMARDLPVRLGASIEKRKGRPIPQADTDGPAQSTGLADPPSVEEAPPRTPDAADLVEQGILALREGNREAAHDLLLRASQLDPDSEDSWLWRAALAGSAEEKRECLEQLLRVNPANRLARSALALQEQPSKVTPAAGPAGSSATSRTPPPDRLPSQNTTFIWQCEACETINTGPLRVCRSCGRPSPQVEEELMSSGDELLAQGLAGLKAGNEELAYDYFVKACEASPNNELAWHWRAKTAPTVDEVIHCLQQLLQINPRNASVQADLKWALQRREQAQPQQVRPDQKRRAETEARSQRVAVQLRRITGELRWRVLQAAATCAFALALVLTIPYVRLAGPPDRPELGELLALLPALGLPELTVHASNLPTFDVGLALPLLLGLLLLQAAFSVARHGGLGARVRMALLAAAAGGLMLYFGTNPPATWYAAGLAALAFSGALAGSVPSETREHDGTLSISGRR